MGCLVGVFLSMSSLSSSNSITSCGDLTVEGVEADEATLTGLPRPVPLPGRAK